MHRLVLLAAVLLFAVQVEPAVAQREVVERLEKSPRHHEFVDIEAPGGRKVHTWVVYPEVDKPATTVIVIHENRGLTDWVRGVADQLAEAGYLAFAPDMLSGTAPGGVNHASQGSARRLRAPARYLAEPDHGLRHGHRCVGTSKRQHHRYGKRIARSVHKIPQRSWQVHRHSRWR